MGKYCKPRRVVKISEPHKTCTLARFTETDYLETFFANPSDIYGASSVDKAIKNAFTQTRKFIMAQYALTEMEATTIITQVC
jgi:hypothetical protein